MTDLRSASSIFPPFPQPVIAISTRPALLRACQYFGEHPFTALSPTHAGASFGVHWWLSLMEGTAIPSLLDCGASTALALEALHAGIAGVICRDFRAGLPSGMKGRLLSHRPPCTDILALTIT